MPLGITNSRLTSLLRPTPTSPSARTPLLKGYPSSSSPPMAANPGEGLGSKPPFRPLPKGKKPTTPPQATAETANSSTKQAQGNNSQGVGHGAENDFLSKKLAEAEKAFKDGTLQDWLKQNMSAVLGFMGAFTYLNLMWADQRAANVITTQAELNTTQQILQINSAAINAIKSS